MILMVKHSMLHINVLLNIQHMLVLQNMLEVISCHGCMDGIAKLELDVHMTCACAVTVALLLLLLLLVLVFFLIVIVCKMISYASTCIYDIPPSI